MVDGVRHDNVVPDLRGDSRRESAQPVGLVETRHVLTTVHKSALTGAVVTNDRLRIGRELDEPVVTGVGHEKTVTRKRYRLGRKAEVSVRSLDRHVRGPPGLEGAALQVSRCQVQQQSADRVDMTFPCVLRDDVALGVDEDQGRPGLRGVGAPRDELRIIEYGMLDAVPLDGSHQRIRVGLVLELRRVHPHHHKLVGEVPLQRPHLIQHVQAVDTAEGPEIENHEAAAQVA